jgi:hypothetical protein
MSPHAANSLVHDLVQMAQAMERLPEVQAELHTAKDEITHLLDRIQHLELKLLDRHNENEELQRKLRDEEAKRSDAETMFLECDDAKSTLERTLQNLRKDIEGVLLAVTPPTAPVVARDTYQGVKGDRPWFAPKVEDQGVVSVPLDPTPLTAATVDLSTSAHSTTESVAAPATTPEPTPDTAGVSVPSDPIATSSDTNPSELLNASSSSAEASQSVPFDNRVKLGPTPSVPASDAFDYDNGYWPNAFNRASHNS